MTCLSGRVFDVLVDLRRDSSTFRRWFSLDLGARDGRSLYVPVGFAHGFMTLEDDTTVHYQISETYRPELARGALWNDPAFGIAWPFDAELILSTRDRGYPPFDAQRDGFSRDEPTGGRRG